MKIRPKYNNYKKKSY